MTGPEPSPSTVAASCTMQALRRAARAVTAAYERELAPLNLTAGQFTILTALGVADAQSIADLGRRIGTDRTTLSRLLTPLRRRGLVGPDTDGRGLALTGTGRSLLEGALPAWQRAQDRLADRLGPERTRLLRSLLGSV